MDGQYQKPIEVTLENGLLKVKRLCETPGLRDYSVSQIASFQRGKKTPTRFRINPNERNQMLLFRTMDENEVNNLYQQIYERKLERWEQKQEKIRNIEELFGDSLPIDSSTSPEPQEYDINEVGSESLYVCAFTDNEHLFCVWGYLTEIYRAIVPLNLSVKRVCLNPKQLTFEMYLNVVNPYALNIGDVSLQIGKLYSKSAPVIQQSTSIPQKVLRNKKYLVPLSLSTPDIANHDAGDDSAVPMEGTSCQLMIPIEGIPVVYNIKYPVSKKDRLGFRHSQREKYVPFISTYCEPCALHIRRSSRENCILVKRFINPVERGPFFRFMESKPVSGLLYQIGRVMNHLPGRKKVALFYEKFSEKAEEGTFELFQRCCRQSRKTNSYFVIDENSADYQRIKDVPHVVRKFSLKYYWLLFNVNYYISTESPFHLSMLNANNHYIRLNFVRHPFIFLQHGVTYLKRQGARSTFVKGRAGQASYVVVNSEKERQVVSDMFHLEPERVWNTGMLIFDQCKYKHIQPDSEDFITIMLTWKPYEEHLTNFEDSSYYQYTMKTYELLQKYVDKSRIAIVGHPRANDMLKQTSIGELLWNRPISEVLAKSKLLITDYSSVCWNSFYQGGGVVFLQPDLAEYEDYVGKLIPKDEEYIGHRVLDFDALDQVLSEGMKNGRINLNYFRTPENEAMYDTINEHHDGKNSERIFQMLKANNIM